MKRVLWICLAFSLMMFGFISHASAQTPAPVTITDDQVNAVASQLFCPVCENTPLDVCPTQACAQWRELIRTKLASGWSADQIKQYFALQYGARVLSEPPRQGLYWLVYIIPPVLILIGIYILYRAYLSMRKPVTADAESDLAPIGDDYLRKIEEELKKRN